MEAIRLEPALEIDLETATNDVIAACKGDTRAAVSALIVKLAAYEVEVAQTRCHLTLMSASVSRGYVRGRGIFQNAACDVAQ